jgi:WNK lysine deficient protein kinase
VHLTIRACFFTFHPESCLAQVDLKRVPDRERTRLSAETKLLSSLHHPHVINFLGVWEANQQVCFTTEIVTSGTLKQYINRVFEKGIKLKIIQKWCRQIASGVQYLHAHDPPIIHRDIKCDNIFINGHSGDICIGALRTACRP